MKALVTGGFGFIGSRLVTKLAAQGNDVTAVFHSTRKNIPEGQYQELQCDLTDFSYVKKIDFSAYDYVFHLAGQGAVWYANKHPYEDFKVNVLATINLLEAMAVSRAKMVFASSCALYPEGVNDETVQPVLDNFYAKSKFYSEQLIQGYPGKHTIARLSFVYGPGMERNIVFDILQGMAKGDVKLFISEDSEIDLIHVDDCCSAMIAIAGKGGIYNVSSGKGIKAKEIAGMMCNGIPVTYGSRFQKMILKNEKIKPFWKPEITLSQGLAGMQAHSQGTGASN